MHPHQDANAGARLLAVLSLVLAARVPIAQETTGEPGSGQSAPTHPYLLGVQATEVVQAAPSFPSPYAGPNSLPGGEVGLSQTYTLYLGVRVVGSLDAYLEPEAATGTAPGQGMGLAGYGNGDLIGEQGRFEVYVARAFLRWRMALGPEREPPVQLGRARYLAEESVPARRLVVTLGQLAVTDLLDQNLYANSPRTQFLNVAFVNDLAYDLPQMRVPAQADHGFRSMPITDSGRSRSPIPEQADR
jgi:high affinity Mn2+ porin